MKTYTDGTGQGPFTMTTTAHQRSEWSRAAQALYARGCNAEGHLLSACATKEVLPIAQFDRAGEAYRAWLVFDEPKPKRSLLGAIAAREWSND